MNSLDVKNMFNEISRRYDFINQVISFCMHKVFKFQAVNSLQIDSNMKILDLCCGSGDIAILIKEKFPENEVIGVDFSYEMLKIARTKNKQINFIEADVLNLPFKDNSFDVLTIAFGFRNIENKQKVLDEIFRVLKKDGKLLHLDFEGKSRFAFIYDKIILFFLRFFVKNLEPYKYLINSKNAFYESRELVEVFVNRGFEFMKCEKLFFNVVSYHLFKK